MVKKLNVSFWKCGKCLKFFKISSISMRLLRTCRHKPMCPFCYSKVTNRTHKEAYDKYILKGEIKRDIQICESLKPWFMQDKER